MAPLLDKDKNLIDISLQKLRTITAN